MLLPAFAVKLMSVFPVTAAVFTLLRPVPRRYTLSVKGVIDPVKITAWPIVGLYAPSERLLNAEKSIVAPLFVSSAIAPAEVATMREPMVARGFVEPVSTSDPPAFTVTVAPVVPGMAFTLAKTRAPPPAATFTATFVLVVLSAESVSTPVPVLFSTLPAAPEISPLRITSLWMPLSKTSTVRVPPARSIGF